MKSEAISLLLLVLLPFGGVVLAARDIFEGMVVQTTAKFPDKLPEDAEEHGEGLTTCIEDIVPEDPIKMELNIGTMAKIQNIANEMPEPLVMPDFSQTWNQLTNVFLLPKFSLMGEQLKAIMMEYRAPLDSYIQRWMLFFNQRRREAVAQLEQVIQKQNNQIKEYFSKHLEEFNEMCLPDENKCLESIHRNLEEYYLRVNKNVAACKQFADRQLDQHARWVENERKMLERPFLRIDGCFEKGRFGSSLASCVGNLISNAAKLVSNGVKKFSESLEKASNSLSDRMGKFQECVVNRKKLLDKGEARIADKAKLCLKNQPGSRGEIFA